MGAVCHVRIAGFATVRGVPSVTDLLARAIDLCGRSLPTCLPIALLAVLAGQAPSAYLLLRGESLALAAPKDPGWFLIMGAASLVNLWAWLFMLHRQQALASGEIDEARSAVRNALRQLPRAMGLVFATGVIVAIGAVLLLIPGLYLLVALWPALAILALEDAGVLESLDRALRCVRGCWWPTALLLLVTLSVVLGMFVVGGLVGLAVGGRGSMISAMISGALAAFFPPFVTAVLQVQHASLQTRAGQDSSPSSSA